MKSYCVFFKATNSYLYYKIEFNWFRSASLQKPKTSVFGFPKIADFLGRSNVKAFRMIISKHDLFRVFFRVTRFHIFCGIIRSFFHLHVDGNRL